MPASSRDVEIEAGTETVKDALRRVLLHPCRTFVLGWNWKAGVLSASFRGVLFAAVLTKWLLRGEMAALAGVAIQLAFRFAVGGIWGSLVQVFRLARPAWLAVLVVAVLIPCTVHVMEYAAMTAFHASHIRTGMIISVGISIASLLLNWGLMRRGLLLTGAGTESLGADLRRVPRALGDLLLLRRQA